MNLRLFLCLCLCPLALFAEGTSPEIDKAALSKTLGHMIVRSLKQPGLDFDIDLIVAGIQAEKNGQPAPMSEEDYEQLICLLQDKQFALLAEKNISEANTFLSSNAEKEGVIALDTKLQYQVVRTGSGEPVSSDSVPLIQYKGTLLDGTTFASSDIPIALPLKQSIPGFSKGLEGMREGEKRTLYIHPELTQGLAAQLPPNALVIFEVEVIKANAIDSGAIATQEPRTKSKR